MRAYCQAQGLWRDASTPEPWFTDTLELDMSSIEPSLAGPKRPQDRVLLSEVDDQFNHELEHTYKKHNEPRVSVDGENYDLGNGDVVIAAITSCTNTSNPSVLVAAGPSPGRRARRAPKQAVGQDQPCARKQGGHRLSQRKRAQRRSERARLRPRRLWLHDLHRQFGAAAEPISKAINEKDLVAVSVLSGNRNFEGRVSPDCRANYLASPPWSSPMRSRAPSGPT